jgi:hypothetical protein
LETSEDEASSSSDEEWSEWSDEQGGNRPAAAAATAGRRQQQQQGRNPQPTPQQQQQARNPQPASQQQQPAAPPPPPQQQQQRLHFYAFDSQEPFVLWQVQPGSVVLYDSDLAFLRQLEVYQVSRLAGWVCEHMAGPNDVACRVLCWLPCAVLAVRAS